MMCIVEGPTDNYHQPHQLPSALSVFSLATKDLVVSQNRTADMDLAWVFKCIDAICIFNVKCYSYLDKHVTKAE